LPWVGRCWRKDETRRRSRHSNAAFSSIQTTIVLKLGLLFPGTGLRCVHGKVTFRGICLLCGVSFWQPPLCTLLNRVSCSLRSSLFQIARVGTIRKLAHDSTHLPLRNCDAHLCQVRCKFWRHQHPHVVSSKVPDYTGRARASQQWEQDPRRRPWKVDTTTVRVQRRRMKPRPSGKGVVGLQIGDF
jgi:hypothetical protein